MQFQPAIRFSFLSFRNVALGTVFVLFASSACLAGEVVDRIERTFPVKDRPLLYIRNSDGRTTLRATAATEVRIVAVKEVLRASSAEEARRLAEQVEVRIEQVGSRIEVEARYPRMSGFWDRNTQVLVHFDVSAPTGSDLDAHNSDGALEADGFNGRISLSTSDGTLTATSCSGIINAHVSDGEIRIAAAQGELQARSSDGRMTIDGSFKALDVRSSDGNVNITVLPGSVMERSWSINSSDGSIQLRLPSGFAADLDVSTSDGSIRLDHPVTLTGGAISKHHVLGKLNGGGQSLRIHASDGSVSVI